MAASFEPYRWESSLATFSKMPFLRNFRPPATPARDAGASVRALGGSASSRTTVLASCDASRAKSKYRPHSSDERWTMLAAVEVSRHR